MKKVKSYTDVVPDAKGLSFDIKRMEDIYEDHQGKIDDPHRHDYYTVLLVKVGKGQHIIDFNTFQLDAQQVYFISPGQVHQIVEKQKSIGYAMTFSEDFLIQNDISKRFIQDLHIFHLNGYSPPLEIDKKTIENLYKYCENIEREKNENSKYTYLSIGSWLKLFLIKCQEHCSKIPLIDTQAGHTSTTLIQQFQTLLENKYAEWHRVSQFADALYITADHLNATISQHTGQNVKAHIQNRIILAAKRQLLFSNKTSKEIGYDLGFNEASHFSQFFKKCVGLSPSAFRKSN